MYVLGIDIGTQGTRAIIATTDGCTVGQAERSFPTGAVTSQANGIFEQDPAMWHESLLGIIRQALANLKGHTAGEIRALAVTSTSGTLCLLDENSVPLTPAIMYSDTRAENIIDQLHQDGASQEEKLGIRFKSSFALARLYWFAKNQPQILSKARWAASPTDLALQWLGAEPGLTDWSNALKTGYDVQDLCWPTFIPDSIRSILPTVVAPGTVIGAVTRQVASQTGLHPGTLLVAGATDGTAAQMASGAAQPGQWNTTIGTTMVIKGVTEHLIRDSQGRVYCHRHPQGYWLPGGASNTGADCIAARFPEPDRLDKSGLELLPTDAIIYPLERKGERFPFVAPQARGFVTGTMPEDETGQYRAYLEGLAYLERLSYETLEQLGAPVGKQICSAGGATKSQTGLQIRADVLHREIIVPQNPSGAMGAAILASRGCAYGSISDAVSNMVHVNHQVAPRSRFTEDYDTRYQRFVYELEKRGYL